MLGRKVSEFCLPNQDEEQICFRDIKGRWIILYFYPEDTSPESTTQACDFTDALPIFDDLNTIVLGVSPNAPIKHRNFIDQKGLDITLLADEDKKLSHEFGVWQPKEYMEVMRSTFIINPKGEISAVWKKVQIKGHIEEVKRELKRLVNSI